MVNNAVADIDTTKTAQLIRILGAASADTTAICPYKHPLERTFLMDVLTFTSKSDFFAKALEIYHCINSLSEKNKIFIWSITNTPFSKTDILNIEPPAPAGSGIKYGIKIINEFSMVPYTLSTMKYKTQKMYIDFELWMRTIQNELEYIVNFYMNFCNKFWFIVWLCVVYIGGVATYKRATVKHARLTEHGFDDDEYLRIGGGGGEHYTIEKL
jgi:hypothetical protein